MTEESAASPLPFEVKAVVNKTLLCVESQDEIQDVMRKSLTRMGYRVFVVRDAELAAERYREGPTDAVIFDFDGQGEDAINGLLDAFADLAGALAPSNGDASRA